MNGNINKELTEHLRNNDQEAFNVLYWKYHSAIYYNVLKLTRDNVIAEDLVQEVFIALWKKRSTLDPEQDILGWLFVVSYNKSISYLKQKLKESLVHASLQQPVDVEEKIDAGEELVNGLDSRIME